jgi:hypothetical protein
MKTSPPTPFFLLIFSNCISSHGSLQSLSKMCTEFKESQENPDEIIVIEKYTLRKALKVLSYEIF